MQKTLVVWRRLGKEHGESLGFRLNPPEVVERHIRSKIDRFKTCPESDWRWWQLSEDLIIEKPFLNDGFNDRTLIYYIPSKNWAIIEDIAFPTLDPKWYWYIHIAQTVYSVDHSAWIMTDLFADVIANKNSSEHTILDLNELAHAMDRHLISVSQLSTALNSCQELLDLIQKGLFPPETIKESLAFLKEREWK